MTVLFGLRQRAPHLTLALAAALLSGLAGAMSENCGGDGSWCACPGETQCLSPYSTCEEACGLTRGGGGGYSAPDNSWYIQQQRLEQERLEQERLEQERLAEEARKRQAEINRQYDEDQQHKREQAGDEARRVRANRDAAIGQLKGGGMTSAPTLKGGPVRVDTALKGAPTITDTGLKDAVADRGSASSAARAAQAAAWRQLNCASYIAGFALSALQQRGDYQEFGALSVEALKAMDGQSPGVECPSGPAMPGAGVPVARSQALQAKERQILQRGAAIAERMKQSGDKPKTLEPATPPAGETAAEKMRRVQRELNAVNEKKVSGKTTAAIAQEEKDRKELARLVLENEKLTSVGFDKSEEAAPTPRRKSATTH